MIPRLRVSVLVAIIGAATTSVVLGQNASSVLSHAYTPVLENEWVKVVRVHYAPHVKLPAHPHTELAAAYVYLSDSGPVVFRHVGASYGAATRPAVKAGTFRLYRAVKEVHEVENTSPLASDFLRIEFKTEPLDAALLRGRFARESATIGNNKVEFENAQIRITRLALAAGEPRIVPQTFRYPSLFVDTTSGRVQWAASDEGTKFDPASISGDDILQFEFKTVPEK